MTFPLDKILNVSPTEYCASVGSRLSSYEMRGVHVSAREDELIQEFARAVPIGAEVVVNYMPCYTASASASALIIGKNADGTALIRKERVPVVIGEA